FRSGRAFFQGAKTKSVPAIYCKVMPFLATSPCNILSIFGEHQQSQDQGRSVFFMRRTLFLALFLLLLSCGVHKAPTEEFRGVWIATVANIDWPERPDDPVAKKKEDFLAILDFYRAMNFNAAIVQVRTAGDALYATDLAPWSAYLSPKQGEAPQDFGAPLDWMIEQTHKRGMEFHAWLNPYRATFDLDTLALAPTHDFYQHPQW